MALKTTVKVTVNNLSDARYCAGMGVDFIGFSPNPDNPFYLSPESFKEIAEWLSGVYFVAEVDENVDLSNYDVELVQITNPAQAILFETKNVILEGSLKELKDWKEQLKNIPNLSFVIVNIDRDKENLEVVVSEFGDLKILLGYDFDPGEANKIAELSAGIALKGSNEIRPGFKDYDALADILESLEVDEPY